MPGIVLLTSDGGEPADVLPGLALLTLGIEIAPLTTSALAANLDADVLILDGRRDLVSARSICRAASGAMEAPPTLLVLEEGGFAVVSVSWGASETVAYNAPPAEIQARIRMLVDRAQAESSSTSDAPVLNTGGLVIDAGAFTAKLNGNALDLTYKEFELLRYFAEHPGRVISRDSLLQEVWGYDYFGGSRTVDVHVRRLRAKLGPEHETLISTVRNVGYRFDP
ncbi:MAG: response regulator transcription factor [Ancrocorticia sp.]|jgi:DNA-binding response OmpR family regulator|nr:response regulator transcription factor [Ancrocorticia sp.]MCI1896422.1 response regulator transcription factor [Ancrocorticia sp.]MCI1932615.1 response regulator transcription factor [Ancrocorticia sp.]MCI1962572.1 response regulator transcription factor [Ancrocorticia sp.]MCI2002499.1 response regulator transcription factor [Ancrocorticia sp.]